MPEGQTLYDLDAIRGRVSLSGLIGRAVKLRRSGRGFMGLCPFHTENSPSFHVDDDRGSYHCYGCGAHGDLFKWVMERENCDFATAVRLLATDAAIDGQIAPTRESMKAQRGPDDVEMIDGLTVARWMWMRSIPARDTIVEAYLASRGLDPALAFGAAPAGLDALRFVRDAPVVPWRVGGCADDVRRRAPAMIGCMTDAIGQLTGVHATYLRRDGRGKADFGVTDRGKARPARKMWGSPSGCAVWLAGLPSRDASLPLVVGEGIETVWAFVQHLARPCRAAAALSLDNLQGAFAFTPQGAWPLWRMRADPTRAPFTIPDPGDVLLLVDADMKPLKDRKVQLGRGLPWVRHDIGGEERARICADLASQHWRLAGARRVEAVRPPMGMDFNDSLRRATA